MNSQNSTLQHEPIFLSPFELQTRWGIGRTMTYETIARPTFPAPLRFGKSLRFRLAEVQAWEAGTAAVGPQIPPRRTSGRKAVA